MYFPGLLQYQYCSIDAALSTSAQRGIKVYLFAQALCNERLTGIH
jgi:hypothetical protein